MSKTASLNFQQHECQHEAGLQAISGRDLHCSHYSKFHRSKRPEVVVGKVTQEDT